MSLLFGYERASRSVGAPSLFYDLHFRFLSSTESIITAGGKGEGEGGGEEGGGTSLHKLYIGLCCPKGYGFAAFWVINIGYRFWLYSICIVHKEGKSFAL